jgi:hypothetical protein
MCIVYASMSPFLNHLHFLGHLPHYWDVMNFPFLYLYHFHFNKIE